MSIVKTSLVIVALTFGFASTVNAATYVEADPSKESQVCVAAATASKIGMYIKARDFKASNMAYNNLKFLANNLYCNGENIADFAKSAGNNAVAAQLNRFRDTSVEIHDLANMSHGTVHVGSK